MAKIVYIGAGSKGFARSFITDPRAARNPRNAGHPAYYGKGMP